MGTKQVNLRQNANSYAVTIAINTAISDAVDVAAFGPRGLAIQTPAVWTAADIGFVLSADGINYYPLYDENGDRVLITTVATGAAQIYTAPAALWAAGAYTHLKLVSLDTSTGAPANQAAARALVVKVLA